MPSITIKILKGKTVEQKRVLVKDITEMIVKNIGVTPEVVNIDIVEYSSENIANAGQLLVDRGLQAVKEGTRIPGWRAECSYDIGQGKVQPGFLRRWN